jgi:hypothetical protein
MNKKIKNTLIFTLLLIFFGGSYVYASDKWLIWDLFNFYSSLSENWTTISNQWRLDWKNIKDNTITNYEIDNTDDYVVKTLSLWDTNTKLQKWSNNSLKIQTNYGYLDIWPKNTSRSHFYTDRPRYYFNKSITVDEGKIWSYNEDLQLQTSWTTRVTIKNSNGYVWIWTTYPQAKLDVSGEIKSRIWTDWNILKWSNNWYIKRITDQWWVQISADSSVVIHAWDHHTNYEADLWIRNNTTSENIFLTSDNNVYIKTNYQNWASNFQNFSFLSNWNMWIWTTSPSNKLEVVWNIEISWWNYWAKTKRNCRRVWVRVDRSFFDTLWQVYKEVVRLCLNLENRYTPVILVWVLGSVLLFPNEAGFLSISIGKVFVVGIEFKTKI